MSLAHPLKVNQKLVVRAGDFVRVGYDLRMALELADTAIAMLEHHGLEPVRVERMKELSGRLRGRRP